MIATADNKRRVVLPKPTRPGDVFDVDTVGHGRFLLTRLGKPPAQQSRLARRNGYLMIVTERPITTEETLKAIEEFP